MLIPVTNFFVAPSLSPAETAIAVTVFFAQALKEWGIPSPGVTQSAMIFAGYKLTSGDPATGLIIAMATLLGFMTGSATLYLMSRSAGGSVTRVLNRLLRLKPQRLEELKARLNSAHWQVVMVGRFIPALMAPLTIAAGLVKFPVRSFYFGTGLAMLVWLVFFGAIGVIWGNAALDFLTPKFSLWFSILLLLVFVGGGLFWFIRRTKTDERAVDG
jgi:membrane protein DedA with SNARE-associated domain